MKREILFRGITKHTSQPEMIFGFLIEREGKHFIWESGAKAITPTGIYVGTEVDPETVGQYTGLQDKNGVEIFEGDCIKVHSFRPSSDAKYDYNKEDYTDYVDVQTLVVFEGGCYGLHVQDLGFIPLINIDNIEVTGNIHED